MPSRDDLSKTMRIDVNPEFMDGSNDSEKTQSWTLCNCDDIEFIARKNRKDKRSDDYVKLMQSIYDAVIITNAEGVIVDFNFRALDFFGYDEISFTDMSVISLISGADNTLLDALRNNLKEHRYTIVEARCVRNDKTTFPAEIAVSNINLTVSGELCFFVRDITVRKQTQDALEDAIRRLEEHDKARTQFVSNVSHELRTPLTSIIYAVSNMLRGITGPLPDRALNYLRMIEGDSKRLLNTVNDILDINKIEDKTLTLNCTIFPLGSLLRYSAESLRVQAAAKNIELFISTDKKEYFVNGDISRLERVIINVVGNAVKFTPENGKIRVELVADEKMVYISVSDTGIGIPPDMIEKVTMRYFTVGIQPSGSGLGLAISKEIAELHGGTLEIISPPPDQEHGTQVLVGLPMIPPPNVLVAYSDESIANALERQLAEYGYTVHHQKCTENIISDIKSSNPDVLMLDLSEDTAGKIERIAEIKGDNDLRRLPIIVVISEQLRSSQEEILNTLNIPILTNPWDESTLTQCLAGVFLGMS